VKFSRFEDFAAWVRDAQCYIDDKPRDHGRIEVHELYVPYSEFDDEALHSIMQFPELARVQMAILNDSKVTDNGLSALRRAQHLDFLDLYGCRMGDEGLIALGTLPKLEFIRTSGRGVSDKGVQALANMPSLQRGVVSRRG